MWPAVSPRESIRCWHWPFCLLSVVSLCMTTTHSTRSLCAAAQTMRGKNATTDRVRANETVDPDCVLDSFFVCTKKIQ